MNTKYSINEFVDVLTKQNVIMGLRDRFVKRRKEQKISQKELASLSGVSYASVRRFEKTCEISLSSLLKISEAINCLEDFNNVFNSQVITNLKDYKP